MNSTGLCVRKFDGETFLKEDFFILSPERKLTKKEKTAEESISNFEYVFYKCEDLKTYTFNNHFLEYWKSYNMISCANAAKETIERLIKDEPGKIHIVMEGISYGSSIRTRSIFDLAGLNYLIREKFVEKDNYTITIATPSEIKKFASGNGNCNKDMMITLFQMSHPEFEVLPKLDDISDAWFMSNYSRKLTELEEN